MTFREILACWKFCPSSQAQMREDLSVFKSIDKKFYRLAIKTLDAADEVSAYIKSREEQKCQ